MLTTLCLPVFACLCIQITETKALTHLMLSLALGLVLVFARSQRKVLRRWLYNADKRWKEMMESWSKTISTWQAKIRPRPNTDEPLKESVNKYHYEFVGECYIHGMMDGEAIKYQNDNEIKAEMFELR